MHQPSAERIRNTLRTREYAASANNVTLSLSPFISLSAIPSALFLNDAKKEKSALLYNARRGARSQTASAQTAPPRGVQASISGVSPTAAISRVRPTVSISRVRRYFIHGSRLTLSCRCMPARTFHTLPRHFANIHLRYLHACKLQINTPYRRNSYLVKIPFPEMRIITKHISLQHIWRHPLRDNLTRHLRITQLLQRGQSLVAAYYHILPLVRIHKQLPQSYHPWIVPYTLHQLAEFPKLNTTGVPWQPLNLPLVTNQVLARQQPRLHALYRLQTNSFLHNFVFLLPHFSCSNQQPPNRTTLHSPTAPFFSPRVKKRGGEVWRYTPSVKKTAPPMSGTAP